MGLNCLCTVLAFLLCAAAHGAETNSMRTIVKATFSGIQEESKLVITNKAGWEALWKKHVAKAEPKEPAPAVDFAKESVIVVAQGQKRSGGYSTEIVNLDEAGKKTIVSYKNKSPKPGAITLQALTAPIHIVAVPKIAGEVQFKSLE